MKTINDNQIKQIFQKYGINQIHIYTDDAVNNYIHFYYNLGYHSKGLSVLLMEDLSNLFNTWDYFLNHYSDHSSNLELTISKELIEIRK